MSIKRMGRGFGLVAAAIWLYALPPSQTTALIVAYGLLVQAYAVWKLRHFGSGTLASIARCSARREQYAAACDGQLGGWTKQ